MGKDAGAGTSVVRDVGADTGLERGVWAQCSGVDGGMEQVPERDVGAGSLLAGGGGAWCIPGGLGCWYWSGWVWWRGHRFAGMMDKDPVCRVGEIEQGPVGWG